MAVLVHGDTSYLLLAADAATPARIAFYLRHTSGILGVALSPDRIDALRLAPANAEPPGLSGAVAMVPVDLGTRADRGASAGDRAATILALADPDSRPGQFIRPGHVVPLRTPRTSRADERDPAVAALDLARLSGRGAAEARTKKRRPPAKGPVTAGTLFSGIHYIRARKNILGAISLDLFVVLLGGATALLPAYARDILHTGPWGLGLLRLSPAIGALSTSVVKVSTSGRDAALRWSLVSHAVQ